MGSRTGTTTRTKTKALEKEGTRRGLDSLSGLEAQVVRMRHGISEDYDAEVGQPSAACDTATKRRLRRIEEQVLQRASARRPGTRNAVRDKIIRALKKKD